MKYFREAFPMLSNAAFGAYVAYAFPLSRIYLVTMGMSIGSSLMMALRDAETLMKEAQEKPREENL